LGQVRGFEAGESGCPGPPTARLLHRLCDPRSPGRGVIAPTDDVNPAVPGNPGPPDQDGTSDRARRVYAELLARARVVARRITERVRLLLEGAPPTEPPDGARAREIGGKVEAEEAPHGCWGLLISRG
jgi:hypothetical protein